MGGNNFSSPNAEAYTIKKTPDLELGQGSYGAVYKIKNKKT